MKAIVLILAVFIFAQFSAFGQNSIIKGKVADAVSSELLVGASVILNDNQQIISTDALGNFQFSNLAAGTYQIKVSYIAYDSQTLSVSIDGTETKFFEINLDPSSTNLEEIVIVSPNSKEEIMTTLSKIDVALRPVKSSQDVLRMIPGLVTAQHAGGGKAEQIFLRGFDVDHGTDITLSVDGMPVNMVSHAHGQGYADLHFVIPELIDYVDFNKGPYSSNVGDFNTAGYANFQTKNALENSSIKMEAGRFNSFRTVALLDLLGSSSKNQNAYIAADYSMTDGPFDSPQNFNRINLMAKYHGIIGNDKTISMSFSTFKSEWDASGQIPVRAVREGLISRFGAIDDTEGGYTDRTNANVIVTKVNEDGSTFRNQVFFSNYNFELFSNFTYFLNDEIDGDAIVQKESRNIYGYNGSYQNDFLVNGKKLRTETGLSIRYDDISDRELSNVKARYTFLNARVLSDIDQANAGLYTNLFYDISPKWNVNIGLRADAFSFQLADKLDSLYQKQTASASILNPKFNLYYNVNSNLQIYFKSGSGFHSNQAQVVVEEGSGNTLPRAISTDLGIFVKPRKNLFINAAIWQLGLEDELIFVGDEAVVESGGRTQRYGADLSIRYQALPWLFVDFDGNYAKGRLVDEAEGEDNIPLAPRFTSIAGLTGSWNNGLKASLRYRFVGDRPANEDNSVTAEGYFLLDGGVSFTRPRYEISLNAMNILNQDWNEAQFDAETRLIGEAEGISELTFTPGDPLFIRAGLTFFF